MKFLGHLVEQYRPLAQSLAADELYRQARQNGVKQLDAFVLLRDLYNYNLAECQAVEKRFKADSTPQNP